MSTAIKTAAITAFIVVALAFLTPLIAQLIPAIEPAVSGLQSAIVTLAPYFKMGRELINLLFGSPVLVDVILWSELVLWLVVEMSDYAVKIAGLFIRHT